MNLLERESLTEKAPLARSHLNEVLHSDSDGWDALEHLAQRTVPSLGRLDLDITAMIQDLRVAHGMLRQTFLTSAKKLDQTIVIAGIATAPNGKP